LTPTVVIYIKTIATLCQYNDRCTFRMDHRETRWEGVDWMHLV